MFALYHAMSGCAIPELRSGLLAALFMLIQCHTRSTRTPTRLEIVCPTNQEAPNSYLWLAIPMRVGCWCGFGSHGFTILPNGADMALHPACTFVCRPCTPTRLGTVRGNGLIVPAHAYLGCQDQSPCVMAPGAFHPDSLSGFTLLVWWLAL